MKRYFALFTATLILVANCIVYTPVKAVGTSVDFAEMFSEYLSLAEMSMALTQGVEVDWSNFEFDENSSNQEKAKALLNYYYTLLYNGVDFFLDLSGNYDIATEQVAAISLQTASNLTPDNIQDLRSQVTSAIANYNNSNVWDHVMQTYNDKAIAAWNKYNSMQINNYISDLNYVRNAIETFTPADYLTKVDKVVNFYYILNNVQYNLLTLPLYTQSNTWDVWNNRNNYSYVISQNNQFYCAIDKVNFQLNGEGNNWILNVSSAITPHYDDVFGNKPTYNNQVQYYRSIKPYSIINNVLRLDFASNSIKTQNTTFPYTFSSIDAALNWINSNYFCCNLSVNGQLWGYSGEVIDNGITVSVPDSVIDNSTDDGKIIAHPIYYPDAVTEDGKINIDLDAVRDSIIDAIANGRRSITMDDVVADGAAVKVDGTTITDADTKTIDASIPIEAAKADTLVVPISAVPGLPKLPPIIPPGGTGGNTLPNGFSGMSVLARIINVTVQSVPEPLIMCFFGVIFGMVVLGIIKILHH